MDVKNLNDDLYIFHRVCNTDATTGLSASSVEELEYFAQWSGIVFRDKITNCWNKEYCGLTVMTL